MSDKSTTNPADLPPIDTSKINIEILELDAPDYQLNFEVPVDLISEIINRIQAGGLDYDEKQMSGLIVQVCLDEGTSRLDRDSAWGARILTKSMGRFLANEPFTFSAAVDTLPEEYFSIESIPINRNLFTAEDTLIDLELLEQQLQFGTRCEYSGELAHGDEIQCKATVTIAGEEEPLVSLEHCTIHIPSDLQKFILGGLSLEQLGPQLRGCQSAESMSFQLELSEEFPVIALRGKSATVDFSNCTFERVTPSTIAHVLEQYGTPSEAILRTQIKMSLQHNFDRENTNFMIRQLYEYLSQNIDLPVSKRIINKNFDDLCKRELKATGEEKLSEIKLSEIQVKAEKLVRRHTLNSWIQRSFKMAISEDEIDKQAAIIAEERRVRPADIKEEFLAEDKITALANMALERKVFERLKDKMVFTDI